MKVLADEAHGAHFYLARACRERDGGGADMAAISMHKSGGSLTQSSLLVIGPGVEGYVRKVINLTQTTSGSYLLMVSPDISRKNPATRAGDFAKVHGLAQYARDEINDIGDYYAYSRAAQRRYHIRF